MVGNPEVRRSRAEMNTDRAHLTNEIVKTRKHPFFAHATDRHLP